MNKKVSSILVARRFWVLANQAEDSLGLTHLQLQKLTFLAYGWSFPFLGRRLINEPVEAWPLGPVFTNLYYALQKYGTKRRVESVPKSPEELLADEDNAFFLNHQEEWLIDEVFEAYGDLTGSQLVTLTHEKGGPWYQSVPDGDASKANGQHIEDEKIRNFYEAEYIHLPDRVNPNG